MSELLELQKEELLTRIKELRTFLAEEADKAITNADQHNPSKKYYEGMHRAYEIAVYTICDIFEIEPPKGW